MLPVEEEMGKKEYVLRFLWKRRKKIRGEDIWSLDESPCNSQFG